MNTYKDNKLPQARQKTYQRPGNGKQKDGSVKQENGTVTITDELLYLSESGRIRLNEDKLDTLANIIAGMIETGATEEEVMLEAKNTSLAICPSEFGVWICHTAYPYRNVNLPLTRKKKSANTGKQNQPQNSPMKPTDPGVLWIEPTPMMTNTPSATVQPEGTPKKKLRGEGL